MRGEIHRHVVPGGGCAVRVRMRIALGLCAALFLGVPATVPAQAALSSNFYFARSGSDANPCTQAAPCATLKRASELVLAPGHGLYFQRGSSWAGTLTIAESGESGKNVVVGAYEPGAQPKITSATDSCIRIDGNWVTLDNLETSLCGYAGVRVAGDRVIVKYMTSALNVVGIFITSTADLGVYERNTLRDNNRMNVNTPSPANDDSGAFGLLVQGDGNELKNNLITGSDAFSYDYGRDGCAIEIFGASGTNAHDNTATSNNCFVELGKPAADPSSANNRFTYNVISSSERGTQSPKEGSEASALITRGANDSFGPVTETVFSNNKVTLSGAGSAKGKVSGIVCYGGCTSASLELRSNSVRVSGTNSSTGWVDKGFANSDSNTYSPAYPTNLVPGPSDIVVAQ